MKTKARLIKKTKKDGFIVLNRDDSKSFDYLFNLSNDLERKVITYGFSKGTDIHADELVSEHKLMHFSLKIKGKNIRFKTNLKGRYNVSNIMAGVATALQLGVDIKTIKETLEKIPQLEGRWEILQEKPFNVIIDFAHTPNALENVLIRASNLKAKNKKLIVVFGSAGKRDKSKRPLMGRVAANLADIIILTAEDPRGEDVLQINREIEDGARRIVGGERKEIFSIPNREEAIVKAIVRASKGDIIVITGKGHERSMNLDGKTEIPWSDKNITLKYLRK
jgi:UDP-N-acetylmuramoyl-L-alanyl-D-glutamate--2,6-diaminopimelate ligase